MSVDPGRVVVLAAAISDGAAVDWDSEVEAARSRGDLDLVRSLHTLARIAAAHRDAGRESAPVASSLQETQTLDAGTGFEPGRGFPGDGSGVTGEEDLILQWGSLEIMDKLGE